MTVNKDELRELIESDLFGDGAFSLDDLVTSEKKSDEAQEQFFETDLAIEPVDDDLLGAEIAALSGNFFKGLEPEPEAFSVDDFELPEVEPLSITPLTEEPLPEFDMNEDIEQQSDAPVSSFPDADELIAEEEQSLESFFESVGKQLDSVEEEVALDKEETYSQRVDEDDFQEMGETMIDPFPETDVEGVEEEQSLESFFETVEKQLDSVEQEVFEEPSVPMIDPQPELTLPEEPPVAEGRVDVRPIEFPELEERISGQSFDLGFFANIPVKIDVYLGNTTISLKEVYDLTEGAIVSLDKLFGEPLDLRINGQVIAKGEVVAVDNQYGVMIKDIVRSNS